MKTKEMAAYNHDRGLWSDEMLAKLVERGKLTSTDYEEITGEPYTGAMSEAEQVAAILAGEA